MLFDFNSFIEDLRQNPEKKETVEKYEKFVEEIPQDIKEQKWYKEYICDFDTIDYKVPEDIKDDFDWDLLMQLIAWSFSSEWVIDLDEDWKEFIVSVQSGDQYVVKKISELWWFQILRLFEIYVEEQMNLEILIHEDEKEKESILAQRDGKLKRWQLIFDNLNKKEEEQKYKQEKEEKLQNLMDKL